MPVIPFSGKYVLYPGSGGDERPHIDLMLQNTSGRDINDFHVYTFPTSEFVDTPDFTRIRMFHNRRLVAKSDNRADDGSAINDLDNFQVQNIKPAIKDNEFMRFHFYFDQQFAGDEGIVILATFDGALIGSNDPGTASTPIPVGPSVWDIIIQALETGAGVAGAARSLGARLEPSSSSGRGLLASAIAADKRLSDKGLRAMAPAFAANPDAVALLLQEAERRSTCRWQGVTLTANVSSDSDDDSDSGGRL